MNLSEHYNKLYEDSIKKIASDSYEVDTLINSSTDDRFGITLILRPDIKTKNEIQKFLNAVKLIEPDQYFYPDSDLHVTVMSIIACYSGFSQSHIQIDKYIEIIQKSLEGLDAFTIEFRGLTASPSCIMVQGFMSDATLNKIRDNLRANFKDTDLEQSLDKRYTLQTAHSTIFRLKERLTEKAEFLKVLERYRDSYYGSFTVDKLELVYSDWYQRKEYVQKLHTFMLS